MTKKILILLSFLFFSIYFAFAEESITLATYYPSPYGSYNNLTTNNLTASNNVTLATTSGSNVGIGTTDPGTNRLEVAGGTTKTTGGLIIETRASDPASPETGRIWLIN